MNAILEHYKSLVTCLTLAEATDATPAETQSLREEIEKAEAMIDELLTGALMIQEVNRWEANK